MSLPIYPTLQGETYPVVKRSNFRTIVQSADSGLEVRIAEYSYPLWEWDIPYSWLSQEAAISDYQTLQGIVLSAYGQANPLLYNDVTDNSTAGTPALIGTGNASQTQFQIGRTLGGFYEPLYDINNSPYAPLIYLAGVHQTSGYSISATGLITFGSAPGGGVQVTVDFNYYWRVRFIDDVNELSNFVKNWWEGKKITLRQVRVN